MYMHLIAFLAMWILSGFILNWWRHHFESTWWTTPRIIGWSFVLGAVLTVLLNVLLVIVTWGFYIALVAIVLALVFHLVTKVKKTS